MLKYTVNGLVMVGTTLALLTTAGVAMAQSNDGMKAMLADQARCEMLMKQFDAEKTNNQEALALRQKGENDCKDSNAEGPQAGVQELEKALKMINVTPSH